MSSVRTRIHRLRHEPSLRRLAKRWRRWNALLTRLATQHEGHRHITLEEFCQARDDVLASCDECSRRFGPHLATFFRQIRDHVEPWMTPSLIANADRSIRSDLLTHAKQTTAPLQVIHISRKAIVISLCLVCFGILLGVLASLDWNELWNSRWAKQIHYSVQSAVHRFVAGDFKIRLFVACAALVIIGTIALRSTKKG